MAPTETAGNGPAKPTAKATPKPTVPQKIGLEIATPVQPELVTCVVCGHQNPKDTGLCVMCSNYLFH